LAADEIWLLQLIQSSLAGDFNKYSAMTIVDRQNVDTILAEQSQSLSGNYSDNDYISIGNLTNAQCIVTGTLTKTAPTMFLLELSAADTETGVRRASYPPKNCSAQDLRRMSVIKEAAAELLSQLGITLTQAGKKALQDSIDASVENTEAALAIENNVRSQFSMLERLLQNADTFYNMGEIREALWYYKTAAYYFPQNYKGWLGIIRCYSDNFKSFDFYDSEVYMQRAYTMAAGDVEKREVQRIRAQFDVQWPGIQTAREQRKAAEIKRRDENFHNMTFVSENGVLKAYTGSSEEVFVPENITVIGDAAFRQNGRIKRVVLHNRVTAIGNNAFSGCTALTDIAIPPSVSTIGTGAFSDCHALIEIVIPSAITFIPDNAFSTCKNLVEVTIGRGVTDIGKAFTGCEKLPGILIPQSVNTIAEFAFSQCKNLKNVVIANDNIKIGRRAFLGCPVTNKDEMIGKFGAEIFR
jgi:hypothetical protein